MREREEDTRGSWGPAEGKWRTFSERKCKLPILTDWKEGREQRRKNGGKGNNSIALGREEVQQEGGVLH